jgi:uncharacterized membrane protein YgaE (UPF0421/DUF939 family)
MNDIKQFFTKTFPIVRDVLIFTTAVVTLVFNFLASPVREDIRATQRDILAIKDELSSHEAGNAATDDKIGTKLDEFLKYLNSIDVRLSRIEGALGR